MLRGGPADLEPERRVGDRAPGDPALLQCRRSKRRPGSGIPDARDGSAPGPGRRKRCRGRVRVYAQVSRSVSLGLAATTLAFAVVLWETRRAGRVLAGVSLAAAATAAVAGVLFGLQGFSPAAMSAGMASGLLGMVLTVAAAAWVRQRTAGRAAPR